MSVSTWRRAATTYTGGGDGHTGPAVGSRPLSLEFGACNRSFCGHAQVLGRTMCLRLHGEFDEASLPLLVGWFVIQKDRYQEMVVDLGEVTFMDASTLRAFLRAADGAHRSGRQFTLVGASPMVMKMLAIIGATGLVEPSPAVSAEASGGEGPLPQATGAISHA